MICHNIEESLKDERGIFRVADEVTGRLDSIEDGRKPAVVAGVLGERDDGPVAQDEDRQLFNVDLRSA